MSLSNFRTAALAIATFLGAYSLWAFGAELVRPGIGAENRFPSPIAPEDIGSSRRGSLLAASFGVIRGDLWADRVLIDAGNLLGGGEPPLKSLSRSDADAVKAAAERALALRPIDSRIWLLLAEISSRPDLAREQLKMSYYTGPNDTGVMPYRLKFATLPNALESNELREAVRREIRTILVRAPQLKPIILAAYTATQPEGRRFIEMIVSEVDPSFVANLNAVRPK